MNALLKISTGVLAIAGLASGDGSSELTAGKAYVNFLRKTNHTDPIILQTVYDSDLHPLVTVIPYHKDTLAKDSWTSTVRQLKNGTVIVEYGGNTPLQVPVYSSISKNLRIAIEVAVSKMDYLGRLKTPCVISSSRTAKENLIEFNQIPLYSDSGVIVSVSLSHKSVVVPP